MATRPASHRNLHRWGKSGSENTSVQQREADWSYIVRELQGSLQPYQSLIIVSSIILEIWMNENAVHISHLERNCTFSALKVSDIIKIKLKFS